MSLNVHDIIREIDAKQRKSVIIQWAPPGTTPQSGPKEVTNECWLVTIANDPDQYFLELDKKFKGRATDSFKFEIETAQQGIDLSKELYKNYGLAEEDIAIDPDVDTSVTLYLAIHIHYHTN